MSISDTLGGIVIGVALMASATGEWIMGLAVAAGGMVGYVIGWYVYHAAKRLWHRRSLGSV